MKRNIFFSILISLFLISGASVVTAKERVAEYKLPDIRNDFCGPEISPRYCKCAFHNQGCKGSGQSRDGALEFVNGEFQSWVKNGIREFAQRCISGDGIYDSSERTCSKCEGGSYQNGKCVENVAALTDPYDSDCNLNDNFNNSWEKFSDFDSRIRPQDASYEVSQYNRVLDEIAKNIVTVENLEYQMEIDRLFRLEMKEYRKALLGNIRSNLVKSIFRLSWMTYNTVKGAKGSGESYSKIFTSDSTVTQIGAAMKFVQAGVPKGSKAEIDGSTRIGRIKGAAWNATLEVIESGADPKAIALQVYGDGVKSVAAEAKLPSLEFTEEEIGILRDQHLSNQALNELIADSYKENAERRMDVLLLSKEIEDLYIELQDWKEKEFNRVGDGLIEQCKTQGR